MVGRALRDGDRQLGGERDAGRSRRRRSCLLELVGSAEQQLLLGHLDFLENDIALVRGAHDQFFFGDIDQLAHRLGGGGQLHLGQGHLLGTGRSHLGLGRELVRLGQRGRGLNGSLLRLVLNGLEPARGRFHGCFDDHGPWFALLRPNGRLLGPGLGLRLRPFGRLGVDFRELARRARGLHRRLDTAGFRLVFGSDFLGLLGLDFGELAG